MKKYLLPLALSAIVVLGGCSQASSPSDVMSSTKSPSSIMSHSDSASQSYITYNQYQTSKDKYAGSKVVLFFNAKWCFDRRTVNEVLTSNSGKVPAKATVTSVDYGQHTDLRQHYGVVTQHTFMQIDTSGRKTRQWASILVDALLKELQG